MTEMINEHWAVPFDGVKGKGGMNIEGKGNFIGATLNDLKG